MNHPRKRRPIPRHLHHPPRLPLHRPNRHLLRPVRPVPATLVRKAHHLPRLRIHLWMRRHRRHAHLPLKVIPPHRLQRLRIHRKRRPVLLHRQQRPPPKDHVGVTRGAHDPAHPLVIRKRIAVPPKQRAPRRGFRDVPVRADVPVQQVCVAGVQPDGGHGAVAVEVDVVGEERGEARVGLDAEEGAGEGRGEGAGDFEVEEGGFEAGGGVEGGEDGGGGEFGGVGGEEAGGGVVWFWGGGQGGGEGVEVRHCWTREGVGCGGAGWVGGWDGLLTLWDGVLMVRLRGRGDPPGQVSRLSPAPAPANIVRCSGVKNCWARWFGCIREIVGIFGSRNHFPRRPGIK